MTTSAIAFGSGWLYEDTDSNACAFTSRLPALAEESGCCVLDHDLAAEPVDELAYIVEHAGQHLGRKRPMSAVGGELIEPGAGGVRPLPRTGASLEVREGSNHFEGGRIWVSRGTGGPQGDRVDEQVRSDAGVDPVEPFGHSGIVAEAVPEDAEATTRSKHSSCLLGAANGVHPVPGLPGDQDVEGSALAVPLLERRDLDGQSVGPCDVGHARVRFDADHRAAALDEESCDDPGATADIDDSARAGGKEVVEQLRGITRTSTVVLDSVLAERPGTLSILEDHAVMMPVEPLFVVTRPPMFLLDTNVVSEVRKAESGRADLLS